MRHCGRILSIGPLGVVDGVLVTAVGVDARRVVVMLMAVLVLGLEGGIRAETGRVGSGGGSSFSHDDDERGQLDCLSASGGVEARDVLLELNGCD